MLRQWVLGWGRVGGDEVFPQAPAEASWLVVLVLLVVCTYLIAYATAFSPVLFPLCWIKHVYSKLQKKKKKRQRQKNTH